LVAEEEEEEEEELGRGFVLGFEGVGKPEEELEWSGEETGRTMDLPAISSTNIFAALESRRRKSNKKKSLEREKSSNNKNNKNSNEDSSGRESW
jgi:hypothetical protein